MDQPTAEVEKLIRPINVYTDLDLKRRFKIKCTRKDVSMSDKLIQLIESWLAEDAPQ